MALLALAKHFDDKRHNNSIALIDKEYTKSIAKVQIKAFDKFVGSSVLSKSRSNAVVPWSVLK